MTTLNSYCDKTPDKQGKKSTQLVQRAIAGDQRISEAQKSL